MNRFTEFLETKNDKQATHIVQTESGLVHYNFPVNLKIYHEDEDSAARKQQYDNQKELQAFLNLCYEKKMKVFDSFHNKYLPVYLQFKLYDPKTEVVTKIVKLIQNTVKQMFKCTTADLLCVVSKEEDKVHFILPSSRVELKDIIVIRDKVIYLCENYKDGKVLDNAKDIISETIYQRMVYIPRNKAKMYPYLEEQNEEWDLDDIRDRNISPDQFLSFNYYPIKTWDHTTEYTRQMKKTKKADAKKNMMREVKLKTDIEKLEELIEFINKKRCATYLEWKQLGQCIYNIYEGDEEGLGLWQEFSSESQFADNCEEEWEQMRYLDSPTIGTIIHFAKTDNPEKYRIWLNDNMFERLKYCLYPEAGPTDFAQILYDLYGSKFVCAGFKDDNWFVFEKSYWIEMDGSFQISQIISTNNNNFSLVNMFKSLKTSLDQQYKDAPEEEKEACDELVKKCCKVISQLKTPAFKNSIVKEAKELFYNDKFLKMMNANENLLAFENGVLDFTQTVENKDVYIPPTFRPGKPEDMITISVGYDYKQDYTFDHPDVQFVLSHFNKVFTNTNVRKYFWRYCASILVGKNKDKVLPFFTGPKGNNGKSVTMEMLEKVLGEFCKKVNYSFLTADRKDSGATTSDLVLVRHARLIICNEADADKKLRNSVVKELTGNDSMQIRDLFKKAENFNPQFKIIVIANNPPPYDAKDDAMKNRIKILEFNSRFVFRSECSDLPNSYEEQYKQKVFEADKDFSGKIKSMIQPFMWLLVQHFKYYQLEGLNEPLEVSASTSEYNKTNNHVLQFCDECLEAVHGKQIKLQQVFDTYKSWYSSNYNDLKSMLSSKELKAMITKIGYAMTLKNEIMNCDFKH